MRSSAVLVLLMLCACARPGARYEPFTPAQAAQKEGWFPKAKRVLIERSLEIQSADEEAGIITTAWVEDEFVGDKRRMRYTISADGTFITVTSQCQAVHAQAFSMESDTLEDCGDRQPERRSAEAQAIANALAQ
jgi:hypothetical protein